MGVAYYRFARLYSVTSENVILPVCSPIMNTISALSAGSLRSNAFSVVSVSVVPLARQFSDLSCCGLHTVFCL